MENLTFVNQRARPDLHILCRFQHQVPYKGALCINV